jgi:hypothetical protein
MFIFFVCCVFIQIRPVFAIVFSKMTSASGTNARAIHFQVTSYNQATELMKQSAGHLAASQRAGQRGLSESSGAEDEPVEPTGRVKPSKSPHPGIDFDKLHFGRNLFILTFWTNFHPKTDINVSLVLWIVMLNFKVF